MDTTLVEEKFGHGSLGHEIKVTDWKYKNLAPKGSAPFDWSTTYDVEQELSLLLNAPNFKLSVDDQGVSFSCGGMAVSKYAEVLLAFAQKTYSPRSAKYIYAQTFQSGGGTFGGDLMSLVRKQGVSSEVLCPSYQNGSPATEAFMENPSDITLQARTDAVKAESSGYAFVTDFNIDAIAQAVRDNHGAVIEVQGQNNGTWLSAFPMYPLKNISTSLWAHWLYVGKVKMINGKKYIGILNSWGKDTGVFGWQWISEDYINAGFTPIAMIMVFGPKSYQFNKDLYLGITDADVYFLQKRLNQDPDTIIASSGPGSPGNESYYFGNLTQIAMIKFQKKNGIAPLSGYCGSISRALLNQ